MAVRVRLSLSAATGQTIQSAAVLNGGFEVPDPHLLLPAVLAERLLPGYRATAHTRALEGAGGEVKLLEAQSKVEAKVKTSDREGRALTFSVLVSDGDTEVLVSDSGIDALGIRVESFAPGRWRFADETRIRDTEAPEYW